MYRHFLLFSLLLLPTLGCSQMVGGTCSYETLYGTARVVDFKDNKVLAQFNPDKQNFNNEKVSFSRNYQFQLKQPIDGNIGDIYPAELSIITKGSCTPFRLRLLANETHSTGLFIPLDQEGRFPTETPMQIEQIATVFKQLFKHWTHLQLNICGQTTPEGTHEYNLSLGQRHAQKIAKKLEKAGIPSQQIQVISGGEIPCPRCNVFGDELQNGAWLSFLLIDPAR